MLRSVIRSPVLRRIFGGPRDPRFKTPIVTVSIVFPFCYDFVDFSKNLSLMQHTRIADRAAVSSMKEESLKDAGAAFPSPDAFPQPKPKLLKELPLERNEFYDCLYALNPEEDVFSKSTVDFQDVRSRGPLFDNLRKTELDNNPQVPQVVKQQWIYLCVELDQKQQIASRLWDENLELRSRYKEKT
ncbi:hypothetical protein F5Y12DRAFT_153127 [Xylaria sp. FL1777]|nr:hypothetical protein F5Y12DRAFT_153127 [Xylaria sp. FL1777]